MEDAGKLILAQAHHLLDGSLRQLALLGQRLHQDNIAGQSAHQAPSGNEQLPVVFQLSGKGKGAHQLGDAHGDEPPILGIDHAGPPVHQPPLQAELLHQLLQGIRVLPAEKFCHFLQAEALFAAAERLEDVLLFLLSVVFYLYHNSLLILLKKFIKLPLRAG